MGEFRGTAGPWRTGYFPTVVVAGDRTCVADCSGSAMPENYDERLANARLCSAAPDLLAALQQIVADWDSVDERVQVPDEINQDDHWDAARAVIRKALGGTP